MGLGRDVLDRDDLEPGGLQRADRGLAARARPLHEDLDFLQPVLHALAGGGVGRDLGGERRGLARPLEPNRAGAVGFKGSRKSTPFAAQVTADAAAREGMEHGLQKVEVFVKGPGSGRETAIRSLQAAGLEVVSVKDVTPQAHNGVRQRKRRRV